MPLLETLFHDICREEDSWDPSTIFTERAPRRAHGNDNTPTIMPKVHELSKDIGATTLEDSNDPFWCNLERPPLDAQNPIDVEFKEYSNKENNKSSDKYSDKDDIPNNIIPYSKVPPSMMSTQVLVILQLHPQSRGHLKPVLVLPF